MTSNSPTRASFRKQILFAATAVLGAWIVLELIVLACWFLSPNRMEPLHLMYQAHPYRGYSPAPNSVNLARVYSTNSVGLRGPERSVEKSTDTIRIVCIGGSTTLCVGATSDSRTYPAFMEGHLRRHYAGRPFRIEVINAGVGAACTMESIIYFQTRLLDFSPDIALVHHAMNDMYLSVAFHGFESDYTHARRPLEIEPMRPWEWSPLLSYFFARGSVYNPYFPDREGDLLMMINPRPETVHDGGKQRIGGLTPEMIATFERNVKTFIALARGNGVIPVLSTQVLFDDTPVGGHLFRSLQRYNDLLREIARRESLGLIDFDREMDWSPAVFLDTCHLMDAPGGLARKGEFFARRLIELGTIEEAWKKRKEFGDRYALPNETRPGIPFAKGRLSPN